MLNGIMDKHCKGLTYVAIFIHCAFFLQVSDPNVEASEASFTKLIETLMEEPKERELFFQVSGCVRVKVNLSMHK